MKYDFDRYPIEDSRLIELLKASDEISQEDLEELRNQKKANPKTSLVELAVRSEFVSEEYLISLCLVNWVIDKKDSDPKKVEPSQ